MCTSDQSHVSVELRHAPTQPSPFRAPEHVARSSPAPPVIGGNLAPLPPSGPPRHLSLMCILLYLKAGCGEQQGYIRSAYTRMRTQCHDQHQSQEYNGGSTVCCINGHWNWTPDFQSLVSRTCANRGMASNTFLQKGKKILLWIIRQRPIEIESHDNLSLNSRQSL